MENPLSRLEERLRRIRERGGSTLTLSIREAELLIEAIKTTTPESPQNEGAIEIELRGEPF